jgi:hypothetical protein
VELTIETMAERERVDARTAPSDATTAAGFTPRSAPETSAWTVPGSGRSFRSTAMACQRAEPAPSAACRGRCEENDGGRELPDCSAPRLRSGRARLPGTRRWSAPTDRSRRAMSHGGGRHDAGRGRLEGKPAGPVEERPRPRSLLSRSRAHASGRTPRTASTARRLTRTRCSDCRRCAANGADVSPSVVPLLGDIILTAGLKRNPRTEGKPRRRKQQDRCHPDGSCPPDPIRRWWRVGG